MAEFHPSRNQESTCSTGALRKAELVTVMLFQLNALCRPKNFRIGNHGHGEHAKMWKSCMKANSPRCNWTSFTSKVFDLRWRASWQAAVTTLSMKSSAIWRSIWGYKKKNKNKHKFWAVNSKRKLLTVYIIFHVALMNKWLRLNKINKNNKQVASDTLK